MRASFAFALFFAAVAMLLVPAARADDHAASIVIKDNKFQPSQLKVPSGKRIVLTVDNQDASAEEFESHQLGVEKIIPGKSKGIVRIRPLEPGTYPFFGEFHQATAQGTVVAE
jgi:plastocyanin